MILQHTLAFLVFSSLVMSEGRELEIATFCDNDVKIFVTGTTEASGMITTRMLYQETDWQKPRQISTTLNGPGPWTVHGSCVDNGGIAGFANVIKAKGIVKTLTDASGKLNNLLLIKSAKSKDPPVLQGKKWYEHDYPEAGFIQHLGAGPQCIEQKTATWTNIGGKGPIATWNTIFPPSDTETHVVWFGDCDQNLNTQLNFKIELNSSMWNVEPTVPTPSTTAQQPIPVPAYSDVSRVNKPNSPYSAKLHMPKEYGSKPQYTSSDNSDGGSQSSDDVSSENEGYSQGESDATPATPTVDENDTTHESDITRTNNDFGDASQVQGNSAARELCIDLVITLLLAALFV